MFKKLEDIYLKYKLNNNTIDKFRFIENYILNLFNNKIIEDTNDDEKNFWNGLYYEHIEKDYSQMKKYFMMAIELGNSWAMNNLGYYYQYIEKDYPQMKKYYRMAIELGDCSETLYYLENYCDTVEFYHLLNKCVNKNDFINCKIKELEKNKKVFKYINKIRLFKNLNNYKKCSVCLEENVLNICFDCGHEICVDCYVNTKSKCIFNFCNT